MDTVQPSLPPPLSYKDRRSGLIAFGIIEIALGAFFLMSVPLTLFGQILAARKGSFELDFTTVAISLLTPAALAAGLIWLGIGSIKARRWARALLLCFGWIGLLAGVASIAFLISNLGALDAAFRQQGQEIPPGVVLFTKIFTVALTTLFYVIVPGAIVLFYRSPHVKLTCEHLDPVERWTDRCPLPVIAMCCVQVYGAASMLLMTRFGKVMPLAGFLAGGWIARVIWLGFIALSAYGAWGFYRLSYRAWVIYTGAILAMMASSIVTFLKIPVLDYYRAVGIPESQVAQIAANPLFHGNGIVWMSAASFAAFGGWLFYLRRYFVGRNASTA